MKRFILVFALLWAVCGFGQDVPQSERAALINFYHYIGGNYWTNKNNWISNRPVREWYGVTTKEINGVEHISSISLEANKLQGTVLIQDMPMLEELFLGNRVNTNNANENRITYVHLDNANHLKKIDLSYNPTISNINAVVFPSSLEELNLRGMNFTSFNVDTSNLVNLKKIDLSGNRLSSFDFNTLPQTIETLSISGNGLTTVNVNSLTSLKALHLSSNQLSSFDFNTLPQSLERVYADNNQLSNIDVSNLTNLKSLWVVRNLFTSITSNMFPQSLEFLAIFNNKIAYADIGNLSNLKILALGSNRLSSIPQNGLPQSLEELYLWTNQLTSLDISNLTNLKKLNVSENQLTSLDVNHLTNLEVVSVGQNQLTSLDVSNLTNLEVVSVGQNQLTSLDVSNLTNLTSLYVFNNQLTSLNVSNLTNLEELSISDNPISTPLDLNNHHQLRYLSANNTQIPVVKLKSQMNYGSFGMYIGNAVKCIEVHNPALVNPNWHVTWFTGYLGNYRTDCSQYMATAENIAKTHHLTAVSPMGDTLILKGDAKVEKVEIYSTAGQLVKVLLDHDRDVSALSKGVYFLKITTDKGVETIKVIK